MKMKMKKNKTIEKKEAISVRVTELQKLTAEKMSKELFGGVNYSRLIAHFIDNGIEGVPLVGVETEQFKVCYRGLRHILNIKDLWQYQRNEYKKLKNDYEEASLRLATLLNEIEKIEVERAKLQNEIIASVNGFRIVTGVKS